MKVLYKRTAQTTKLGTSFAMQVCISSSLYVMRNKLCFSSGCLNLMRSSSRYGVTLQDEVPR